jgi:hypothetical protein
LNVAVEKLGTARVLIDPYNNFISERGKVGARLKGVAEANDCVPNMLRVLNAACSAGLPVFYALHRHYQAGDYAYSDETMHAALDVNMPNYARAIVTTDAVVAAISSQGE